jgi:hypothetical protein
MPHLRLVTDEPEIDPPAPLPIRNWRPAEATTLSTPLDVVAEVEQSFARGQQIIERLSSELDSLEPLPFPRRRDFDDDGPWAA